MARSKCRAKGGWAFLPDIRRTMGIECALGVCGNALMAQNGVCDLLLDS